MADKHIEHIGDTDANIRANLDTLQIAIQTDDEETFIWADEGADKYFYAARQYSKTAAGAQTFINNQFNRITSHENIYANEYIYRRTDTGDYIRFESDKITIGAGAVAALLVENDIVTFPVGLNNTGASLLIQDDAAQDVEFFSSAAGGETPAIKITGFRNVDAQRTLSIGISGASNDSASYSGVGSHIFDGQIFVTANNDITQVGGTGHITAGTEGFIVGSLTITDGSIVDSDGAITFGATDLTTSGNVQIASDTGGLVLGAGQDASIVYNGTNLVVNPKAVGSGVMLLDTNSKTCWRDTAIGAYSFADTFLDIFADGAVRIGDSSAGAPTNYTNFAPDGLMNMVGTARVTKSVWIPAEALRSAGAKPAAIGVNGNGYVVMTFADNQEKEIQANIKIPEDCDVSATVSLCVGWSSPTADPGDDSKQARWILTCLVTAPNESTDAAGTASAAVLASASTVADGLIVTLTGTITIDTNDVCLHCKLERDGDDATDTLGDIVELHGIALVYTSNKLGTAT